MQLMICILGAPNQHKNESPNRCIKTILYIGKNKQNMPNKRQNFSTWRSFCAMPSGRGFMEQCQIPYPYFLSRASRDCIYRGLLKHMPAYFIDGTDMSMVGFDHQKKDERHAAILECNTEQLASSHQVKRYFDLLR
jgi:hypothetical protein